MLLKVLFDRLEVFLAVYLGFNEVAGYEQALKEQHAAIFLLLLLLLLCLNRFHDLVILVHQGPK